jgi:hypothetical protein
MTSKTLSKEFTVHYPLLEAYTKSQLKQANKKIEHSIILSECYIHLEKYKDQLDVSNDIIIYSKKFIRTNIGWYNSIIYKESKDKFNALDITELHYTKASNDSYVISEENITEKLNEFYNTLTRYDKGLFNIYYINKMQTAKQIEKHLNISNRSAYDTLNECYELERMFVNYIKKYI